MPKEYKFEKKKPGRWEEYKKPLISALLTMLAFFILWLLVVWALARC